MILLVEDDPYDSTLIQRGIKKARILNPVTRLHNGAEAIAYLSGSAPYEDRIKHPQPTLMLLDLKMPKKNGFEVIEWTRKQPTLKRLPIVVLTSSSLSPDINKSYDLGANSYLVKPVGTEALVDLLKSIGVYWLITNENPDLKG